MQASSSRDNPRRKVNADEVFTGVVVRSKAPIKEERAATAAKVSSRGTYDYLCTYYPGTEREKQEKLRRAAGRNETVRGPRPFVYTAWTPDGQIL
jgi:hypothetical protein